MDDFLPYFIGNTLSSILSLSGCFIFTAFGIIQFAFTFQMTAYIKVLSDNLEYNGPKDSIVYQHHKSLIRLILVHNVLIKLFNYF